MSELDGIVHDFLVESYDSLDQLDLDLIALEKNPRENHLLASIFRTIHTIKGTCGFLGLSKLESIAHIGENLLSRLRDGELLLNPDITSGLLAMVDAIRQILSCIEANQKEGDVDYTDLVENLTRLNNGEKFSSSLEAPDSSKEPSPPSGPVQEDSKEEETEPAHPEETPAQENLIETADAVPMNGDTSLTQDKPSNAKSISDTTIRVDVGLLDTLMNLVGELVLARNQIIQYSISQGDSKLTASSQMLNLITTELQEGVMKTRMQPIGNIWDKFPRVIRDLAQTCGKQVRLEMEGKDTELDKTLIEAIKDPLTHIVRNAVDHGIETPEVREQNGKPGEGTLSLRAYHEGGQVNIEISDDGCGIDPERIKQKALSKKLITEEQAMRMSDRELVNLVFSPGFSMAEKITNVSGRGVGMDVVKTNIEKIGGTVDIKTTHGAGTSLKVKIPLTLAIIPALMVGCGENHYAIPQINLLELVRLDGNKGKTSVEFIQGTPVYRLRGNLLPLVYLDQALKVKSGSQDKGEGINIVVLQANDRQFGLVVESINDTEEVVVKPLSKHLKGVSAYAGTTIMGNGRVALILDIIGLAQRTQVITEGRERSALTQETKTQESGADCQTLLVFRIGKSDRMAIPLNQVARLEEIKLSDVESSGDQNVVQYRGEIMPLIHLARIFNGAASRELNDVLEVVVYTHEGKSVGLVVDHILDIVEETLTVKRTINRQGVIGTAVVQGRVTNMLDLEGIIQMAESRPKVHITALKGENS